MVNRTDARSRADDRRGDHGGAIRHVERHQHRRLRDRRPGARLPLRRRRTWYRPAASRLLGRSRGARRHAASAAGSAVRRAACGSSAGRRCSSPCCSTSDAEQTAAKSKRPGIAPGPCCSVDAGRLDRVVHFVLDRMRGHLVAHVLRHLQLDVGVDHVIGHHAAHLEEAAVLVERIERLAQAAGDGRDVGELGRRQIVKVLVHRHRRD